LTVSGRSFRRRQPTLGQGFGMLLEGSLSLAGPVRLASSFRIAFFLLSAVIGFWAPTGSGKGDQADVRLFEAGYSAEAIRRNIAGVDQPVQRPQLIPRYLAAALLLTHWMSSATPRESDRRWQRPCFGGGAPCHRAQTADAATAHSLRGPRVSPAPLSGGVLLPMRGVAKWMTHRG